MKPVWVILLVSLSSTVAAERASAQSPALPQQDVVILALDDAGHSAEGSLRRLTETLFGEKRGLETIRDVQMELVRKTAPFGPVLLLAPDEETRGSVVAECDSYGICDHIGRGRIRIEIVPHDTVWIRDYGPFVDTPQQASGGISMVDAKYDDIRNDVTVKLMLASIARKRRALIEETLSSSVMSLFDTKDDAGALTNELSLLKEYADIIKDQGMYNDRTRDDGAPFAVSQVVLKESIRNNATFSVRSAPIFMDGGNLFRLDDGNCLTTRDLFARNTGRESDLVAELRRAYRCADILFLEALPGPVIEHVDMFVLPVVGKRLLLADYGLDQPHVRDAWLNLSPFERQLMFEAAVSTTKNAALLRRRGYDVTLVPALLPRAIDDDRVFYPTVLNALVRSNGVDKLQVLLPAYEGLDPETQMRAHEVVRDAFGQRASVETIEATVAAKAQGAVHCLTITVPFEVSVFDDAGDTSFRQIWALRDSLNNSIVRVTKPSVIGRWSTRPPRTGLPNSTAIQLVFDESKATMVVDGRSTNASYTLTKTQNFRWPIELTFDGGQRKATGRIDWLTDRSMRLVLEAAEPIMLARELVLEDLETAERIVRVGGAQDGMLGDNDDRDADGSLVQAWAIDGRSGEEVTLDLTSDAFDAEVIVTGPGLSAPLSDDDSGSALNAQLVVRFPESGRYRVIVRAVDRMESGEFSIRAMPGNGSAAARIAALPTDGRSLRVGDEQSGTLTAEFARGEGQAWRLTNCGTDQMIVIDLESDDFDPVLTVTGPDLERPLVNDDSGTDLDSQIEFTCGAGTYTVVVNTADDSTGRFKLRARVLRRR